MNGFAWAVWHLNMMVASGYCYKSESRRGRNPHHERCLPATICYFKPGKVKL